MARSAAAVVAVNLLDLGTPTASSAAAGMPVTNLQDVHTQNRWRSTSPVADVIYDLGYVRLLDTFWLEETTMGATGKVRVRTSKTDPTVAAALTYDSGVNYVDTLVRRAVFCSASVVAARYIRFSQDDSGVPDIYAVPDIFALPDMFGVPANYVEAGRAGAGLREQFAYSFRRGWTAAVVDRSVITEMEGGQTEVDHKNQYDSLKVTFDCITEAQRNDLVQRIDRLNGTHTDILFILNPASSNLARDSIWGLMTAIDEVTESARGVYSKPYRITKRL